MYYGKCALIHDLCVITKQRISEADVNEAEKGI